MRHTLKRKAHRTIPMSRNIHRSRIPGRDRRRLNENYDKATLRQAAEALGFDSVEELENELEYGDVFVYPDCYNEEQYAERYIEDVYGSEEEYLAQTSADDLVSYVEVLYDKLGRKMLMDSTYDVIDGDMWVRNW